MDFVEFTKGSSHWNFTKAIFVEIGLMTLMKPNKGINVSFVVVCITTHAEQHLAMCFFPVVIDRLEDWGLCVSRLSTKQLHLECFIFPLHSNGKVTHFGWLVCTRASSFTIRQLGSPFCSCQEREDWEKLLETHFSFSPEWWIATQTKWEINFGHLSQCAEIQLKEVRKKQQWNPTEIKLKFFLYQSKQRSG